MSFERVLQPPNYFLNFRPKIFLAGPIQDADDWQTEASQLIHTHQPNLWIASPRRNTLDSKTFVYQEQVDWESYYLAEVAKNGGVILFWLPKPARVTARPYAQTTRVEFGRWVERYSKNPDQIKLAVGREAGFPGGQYFDYSLGKFASTVPMQRSLVATCYQALMLLD